MAITADFRVSAFLRLCSQAGAGAYVLKRGDATAGAILVKHAMLDGAATIYARRYDVNGGMLWERATGPEPVPEAEADAYAGRRVRSDPDLWLLEYESASTPPPLEALDDNTGAGDPFSGS